MENKDLALVRPERDVSLAQFEELQAKAATLIKSGFLPAHIRTPEAAVAVAVIGRELGVPMMQSFRHIYVIQGSPTCKTELQLALARRTGEMTHFEYADDGNCATVTITRKGQSSVTTTFSMQDAAGMGLAKKDNWQKQPKVMRMWRAIGANLRLTFPDATGGLYTPEEINPNIEVDASGAPISPPAVDGKPAIAKPKRKEADKIIDVPATPVEPPKEEPKVEAPPDEPQGEMFVPPSYEVLSIEKSTKTNARKQHWYEIVVRNNNEEVRGMTYSETMASVAADAKAKNSRVTIKVALKEKDGQVYTNYVSLEPVMP